MLDLLLVLFVIYVVWNVLKPGPKIYVLKDLVTNEYLGQYGYVKEISKATKLTYRDAYSKCREMIEIFNNGPERFREGNSFKVEVYIDENIQM